MKKILCGVDIGGTKLSIALVTTEGEIIVNCIYCGHVDKPEWGLVDHVKYTINTMLRKNKMEESDLLGIGIGCAGHIRFRDGIIITTSNLKGYTFVNYFSFSGHQCY